MNRLFVMLLPLLAIGTASAQNSTIQIGTSLPGPRFLVDGVLYFGTQTFTWPSGSKHSVQFLEDQALPGQQQVAVQTTVDGGTQFSFGGWKDNNGILSPGSDPNQTVTANPQIFSLIAQVSVNYLVNIRFYSSPAGTIAGCTGAPGGAPAGSMSGAVYLDGTCTVTNVSLFVAPGGHTLNAFPFPGFVFVGWAVNGANPSPYLTNLTVTGPMTVYADFQPAKRVLFLTNPLGLQVLIDRAPTPTSPTVPCAPNLYLPPNAPTGVSPLCYGEFDFLPGSQHVISGVSPQTDRSGNLWVFDQWDNGMGTNASYTVPTNLGTETALTANFVPGAGVSFLTNPGGLQLSVDGRTNWPSYNFTWAVGSTHQVVAPTTQKDPKGRQYTFQGWSTGGTASQTLTVPAGGMRMTANFSVLSQATIQSSPSGLTFQVNGNACQTPCVVNGQSGSPIQVSAPASIPINNGARWDLQSWSDGGTGNSRLVTFNGDTQTVVANYQTSYLLNAVASPPNAVSWQLNPPSPDMYYPSGTQVAITASANPGFKFSRWSGDVSGTYPVATAQITGPMSAIATFTPVPYIAPAGVKSAAGDTPSETMAPGSIISIYGESLAAALTVGPTNPLAQTLGGVTVTVGQYFLPLLFVSPEQINAQVPVELTDGAYMLTVHSAGQSDVSASFNVQRDSPGLFSRPAGNVAFLMASHSDGSAVTSDSPAQAGETLTVFGTGFGPYDKAIVDGFLIDSSATYTVVDPVQINAGSDQVQPIWSGAAAGFVGTTVTTFQVPGDLPSGASVPFTVTVNGQTSNQVMLPLQ